MSDITRNGEWGPRDALYDENTMLRERIGALERELAAAEYHRDGARATVTTLERELAEAREIVLGFNPERQALRAEVERLQALLRQLSKDGRVWVSKESLLDARVELADARTVGAEVEAAFRAGYQEGVSDHFAESHGAGRINGNAAWSRYQQERARADQA